MGGVWVSCDGNSPYWIFSVKVDLLGELGASRLSERSVLDLGFQDLSSWACWIQHSPSSSLLLWWCFFSSGERWILEVDLLLVLIIGMSLC